MLQLVQNWFAPRVNPIGIDFGSDCLRLAQVQFSGAEPRLIAAASTDVPSHVRHNTEARIAFFAEAARDLLAQGNFRSRQAVLALPAASMHIQHVRTAKLDENETRKTLPWEMRGKIPIDPSQALLRHIIAGEVYHDQEPRNEVIVMAASRELVNQLLAAAASAKLDIVGMNVEARAVIDCFAHVYRRQSDTTTTGCFLDIGCGSSRAFIARGEQIYFARAIPIGGDHFNKATAQALKISLDEAKLLRIKLCAAQSSGAEAAPENAPAAAPEPGLENEFAMLDAALQANAAPDAVPDAQDETEDVEMAAAVATAPASGDKSPARVTGSTLAEQTRLVELACRDPLTRLVQELDLCRRYYEATFPNKPVERLVFVGGEARHRGLCLSIAKEMGLAAQVGDPLVRMGRVSDIGIESGIDRRQPQPGWAVAIGLSLGPLTVRASKGTN